MSTQTGASAGVYDNSVVRIATVKSWDTEFIGDISTKLHGILCYYMTIDIQSLYARVVAHVQSSGTGKSRAHDELAKYILYIPLNLAGPLATSMFPLCTCRSLRSHRFS